MKERENIYCLIQALTYCLIQDAAAAVEHVFLNPSYPWVVVVVVVMVTAAVAVRLEYFVPLKRE
jgi:hypothetical protein